MTYDTRAIKRAEHAANFTIRLGIVGKRTSAASTARVGASSRSIGIVLARCALVSVGQRKGIE